MKIIIIGGGITGLYIGYMLKKYNIDFNIYEKSHYVGGKLYKNRFQIYPHQTNIINLLNELNIEYKYNNIKSHIEYDQKLFDKIQYIYTKDRPIDISVRKFLIDILTKQEFDLFMTYIMPLKLDQMEISYYMTYQHNNILKINQSNKVIDINKELINKLTNPIKNNIILNSDVQQITYMPLTNNYMLTINDTIISADKIILTTISNIQLIIQKKITNQLYKFKSYNWLKIKYKTDKDKIEQIDYISSDNDKLYKSIILNTVSANQLFDVFLKKPILKYTYTNHPRSYFIINQRPKTNFYIDYNLLLAINYLNTIEGSCIIGKKIVDIILNQIYSKGSGYLYTICKR